MTETEAATPGATAALAAALAAVQAELPEIKKTRTAKVEKDGRLLYTYDYADLADVSLAILPILGKHGLAFTAFPGHRTDGKFGLRYQLLHKEGGVLEGFYEIADQGGMQMTGGRITYARRYCLCAVTGVAAEDDVDANGSGGDQQQPRTAQRRARTSPPPAAAVTPSAAAPSTPPAQAAAGGDLPPLPGEDEPDPTGAPQRGTASPSSASAPDDTDYDTPGTVTTPQITAIWTVFSNVYEFSRDEKDQARMVCAYIVDHDLESTKDLSRNEAKAILDTLSHWQHQAAEKNEHPRTYMLALMVAGDGEHGE